MYFRSDKTSYTAPENEGVSTLPENNASTTTEQTNATTTENLPPIDETKTIIGSSVEGKQITAYHYGSGDTELLFIGGIHGGYSWNTALVAYELMDYLEKNPNAVPASIKVTVIPVLNPDGLSKVVSPVDSLFTTPSISRDSALLTSARFNANEVDLNRNFDCEWQKTGTWRNTPVSGGTSPFSEPESIAIRDYVASNPPTAVVVWYSAAGGVYASSCNNGVSESTQSITNIYAQASKYPAYKEFDFYAITGDMVNWFARINVPAISVLLTNHTDTEWTKNKAGIEALLNYFAQ